MSSPCHAPYSPRRLEGVGRLASPYRRKNQDRDKKVLKCDTCINNKQQSNEERRYTFEVSCDFHMIAK
jgi:hypothetical protein